MNLFLLFFLRANLDSPLNQLQTLVPDDFPSSFFWISSNYPRDEHSHVEFTLAFLLPHKQTAHDYATRKSPLAVCLELTSFGWDSVSRMLSTVAVDDLVDSVIAAKWEIDLKDVITWLHESQDSLNLFTLLLNGGTFLHVLDQRVFDDLAATVEEVFDLICGRLKNR